VNDTPLLSIVIPWREFPSPPDLASHIVRSARDHGVQVVVVDDASRWGSDTDAKALMQSEGADYIRLDRSAGPGVARNTGLMKARGRFLAFLDADDLPHLEVLNLMAQQGQSGGADVVIGGYHRVSGDGSSQLHMPGSSFVSALNDQPAIWRYIFRREFLEDHQCRFIEGNYAEDLVFLLQILAKDPTVLTLSKVCYEYLDLRNPAQLSRKKLTRAHFETATVEIRAISPPTARREFEQVRTSWLIRIWFRRLRSASDVKSLLSALKEFPMETGFIDASVNLMARRLRGRCRSRLDGTA
jgi:CDP-glycerol glycerophosphotransferase